jgi:uncharacterized metal-binding protein
MSDSTQIIKLQVNKTKGTCPIGQTIGNRNMAQGKIPVLSCEGGCIRGEIARQAANLIAKEKGFARGCHGELFAVPHSAVAEWFRTAEKVILIDGCFLRCHGRIMQNLEFDGELIQFDALSHYQKYKDFFDIDDVPEKERNIVARQVADWVLENLDSQEV